MKPEAHDPILGCLFGGAVGDALGLPTEGVSRSRVNRLCAGSIRHRLIFGRGMLSDDTEHTAMVAKALLRHADDVASFQRSLSWSLRWWFLALPGGVGMATARAILRLWMGFPASRSGVSSAGNGPAMRSAIIGVVCREDALRRAAFARASCEITHADTRAEEAALLVAEAAALAAGHAETSEVLIRLREMIRSDEMSFRFGILESDLKRSCEVVDFADHIGCQCGVSGFAPNSVAVALFAWLRHRGDIACAVEAVIRCGGDTDTVAAIAGGICGAEVGEYGIPSEFIDGIVDWPLSVSHLRKTATAFGSDADRRSIPSLFWPAVLVRNVIFLIIVLCHGFRRLLPPY